MDSFGIPLLIIAVVVIFTVDVLSVSYLKTALLDLRMRRPGFFLSSAGVLIVSAVLSVIMASAFLQNPVTAETPMTETVEMTDLSGAETISETTLEEVKQGAEERAPEMIQSVIQSATIIPNFSIFKGYYKNFSYNFIEIENGTPYAYMPEDRKNFQKDLDNIVKNREGGNIVVIANAGTFDMATSEPLGVTIQNGYIVAKEGQSSSGWTLVVDENNNVGYVKGPIVDNKSVNYIDAKTGKLVRNRKIISAVYAFFPFILNNQIVNEKYKGAYSPFRARQIFCVKQNSYVIITNTGEGKDGGGWNFNDMIQVAKYRNCLSAFNLDGGGSTATAYRTNLNQNFTVLATTKRHDPTFIVFTADNLAPRGK